MGIDGRELSTSHAWKTSAPPTFPGCAVSSIPMSRSCLASSRSSYHKRGWLSTVAGCHFGVVSHLIEILPSSRALKGGVGAVSLPRIVLPAVNKILLRSYVPVIDLSQIPPNDGIR